MFRAIMTCFMTILSVSCICFAETKEVKMSSKNPVVLVKTSKGDIKIELYEDKAPISVKNFLDYATEGYYDGTIFHRVINGFMIQGGGFTKEMVQKPTKGAIKNEATNKVKNMRGTVAMARTSVVDSATAQFFINDADNPFLDYQSPSQYGYAVFGRVIKGMDVVDQIVAVKTDSLDAPLTPIKLDVNVITMNAEQLKEAGFVVK